MSGNNLIADKRIAIIGGGPGGLVLARLLQMNGADVRVYERDAHEDAREKGATLDLHLKSGLAALEAAELLEGFKEIYRPKAGYIRIMDKAGQVRWDEHINGKNGFNRPEVDRGPLVKLLYDSLDPGTVVWDRQFVGMDSEGDGWELEFANGQLSYADMVIAADGARSKVRPYLTPIVPQYSGNMIVEGNVDDSARAVPEIHGLLCEGKIFAFGDSKTLVVSSKGDGSLQFYMGFTADEDWSRNSGINFKNNAEVLEWFKHDFTGWDPLWHALFEQASGGFVTRPQYLMPLDASWEAQPNLTIIGDAAHVMPPYAGEGVNMAMQDALELCQCLTSGEHATTRDAIAAYESAMHERMAETAAETMNNMDWMHGPEGLETMLGFFAGIKERMEA